MAADAIARRHSFSPWAKKFKAEIAEGRIGGEKVLLIKPQTFMNLSGEAVGEALRFYKLEPSAVIVFYDELDLAAARCGSRPAAVPAAITASARSTAHSARTFGACASASAIPASRKWCTAMCSAISPSPTANGWTVLLDSIADNAELIAKGDENGFMNKITLALREKLQPTGDEDRPAPRRATEAKAKPQSHIRQARPHETAVKLPETGPMAAMLKRLFGKD
jgi:peptidyl-tRNA hydrolase, PTH1 family